MLSKPHIQLLQYRFTFGFGFSCDHFESCSDMASEPVDLAIIDFDVTLCQGIRSKNSKTKFLRSVSCIFFVCEILSFICHEKQELPRNSAVHTWIFVMSCRCRNEPNALVFRFYLPNFWHLACIIGYLLVVFVKS